MKKSKWFVASALCGALLTAGCVDDKYDLSDIDTTARIDVKDLIIPVNLDEIYLSSVIKINEGDQIEIIDGRYAVVDSGKFNSDGVKIDVIHLNEPKINPSVSNIYLNPDISGITLPGGEYMLGEYNIKSAKSDFSYNTAHLDNAIISIDTIYAPLSLTLSVTVDNIDRFASKLDFYDVVVQLPAGLIMTDTDGGEYDSETGELMFKQRRIVGSEFSLKVEASAVAFVQMGGEIVEIDGESYADLKGECFVKSGRVQLVTDSHDPITIPNELTMRTVFTLSDIEVRAFTGTVKYDIEGVNINDVDLSDVPALLSQKGTRIRLANPRIYIHLNNPVQQYGLSINAGMTITSYPRFEGENIISKSLDNGQFSIGVGNPDGIYNYCLAPVPDAGIWSYENCQPVKFTGLQNILDTDGLPSKLGISLDNPAVPPTHVSKFQLGTTLGDVDGRYKFIAPFELLEQSVIVYHDIEDGWWSEDMDNLMITKLDVDLDISTNLPLGAVFKGYPLDKDGNRINNVEIVGAEIDPKADNQHLTISVTGAITGLNGIEFEATVTAEGEQTTLNPDMYMKITNLRPRISGYYQKEL